MSIPDLLSLWEPSGRSVRVAVETALAWRSAEALPSLRDWVRVGTRDQKLFACGFLAEARDKESEKVLLAALDDPDPSVRVRALHTLRSVGGRESVERIQSTLSSTDNPLLLNACLSALGDLGGPSDATAIRPYLSHENETVRVCAAYALAALGNSEGQDVLLAATRSTNPQALRESTYSLGFLDTPEAAQRLTEIVNDPNAAWRSEAQIALANQQLRHAPDDLARLALLDTCARDPNRAVWEWALGQIRRMGTVESQHLLNELAQSDSAMGLRASNLSRLGEGRSQ